MKGRDLEQTTSSQYPSFLSSTQSCLGLWFGWLGLAQFVKFQVWPSSQENLFCWALSVPPSQVSSLFARLAMNSCSCLFVTDARVAPCDVQLRKASSKLTFSTDSLKHFCSNFCQPEGHFTKYKTRILFRCFVFTWWSCSCQTLQRNSKATRYQSWEKGEGNQHFYQLSFFFRHSITSSTLITES